MSIRNRIQWIIYRAIVRVLDDGVEVDAAAEDAADSVVAEYILTSRWPDEAHGR